MKRIPPIAIIFTILLLDVFRIKSANLSFSADRGSYLVLNITPNTDAIVKINGEKQIVNDGEVSKFLTSGTYSISIEAPGYDQYIQTITIDDTGTRRIPINLISNKARLTVISQTSASNIEIINKNNGNVINSKRDSISEFYIPGSYIIRVSKDGYHTVKQDVSLPPHENRSVVIPPLTLITGSIDITSNPTGAYITIDGKSYGTTPNMIYDIPLGKHTVVLTKGHYDKFSSSIDVKQDKTEKINHVFTQIDYENQIVAEMKRAQESKDYKRCYDLAMQIQHNIKAQITLGNLYSGGHYVNKDEVESLKWWTKAAEQGDLGWQHRVGSLHFVKKDYDKAVYWYRRAAEGGYAISQRALGDCYFYGYSVPKNAYEAVKWYRKSAEQGLASGQRDLAACYFNGDGVPKDYYEAVKWYRKAAEQGNAAACGRLGYCYENGVGGLRADRNEAIKWYLKGAQGKYGDDFSKEQLKRLGVSY